MPDVVTLDLGNQVSHEIMADILTNLRADAAISGARPLERRALDAQSAMALIQVAGGVLTVASSAWTLIAKIRRTLQDRGIVGAHLTLPNGTAVLSYPPSLHPLAGDKDAVSAGRLGPGGAFQLYLNATPRQGTERLRHWSVFRLTLLRSDDAASAHEVGAAEGVKFRGGTGSCLIDAYVTRIGAHHYQEIACLVQGRTSASVIVAAAPSATWAQARPLLFRAVAAYLVR